MPDLTIRYSAEECILRSTGDDLPGMLVIAAMPPDHPPGFAIDATMEPEIAGRDVKARFDADLEGAEWVEPGDVAAGLVDELAASVLWKAVVDSLKQAADLCLPRFGLEEFGAYHQLMLETAVALAEAGYVPGVDGGE